MLSMLLLRRMRQGIACGILVVAAPGAASAAPEASTATRTIAELMLDPLALVHDCRSIPGEFGISIQARTHYATALKSSPAVVKAPVHQTLQSFDCGGKKSTLGFDYAVIATGSRPATVPGISIESPRLMDSTGALELPDMPKSLLVVGGGYIGLELGSVYAALGTSRPLSVSTTTTIAILSAAALGQAAPGGSAGELIAASATLAILVGALLALASAARLGFVANFISEPVLTGFKSGIGVVIVVDQLPKLLGIHITKAGFFRDLLAIVQHVPDTSMATLLVALGVLVLIFALVLRFDPEARRPSKRAGRDRV